MTSEHNASDEPEKSEKPEKPESREAPATPQYADRCYRSPAAIAGGVVLLVLLLWLTADAVFRGSGRTPVTALAAFVCSAPLLAAFTFRPAVYAGQERLRVRNPFRTVTIPWRSVDVLRAGYSCEVVAEGEKYQLWSIPVSLRARKSVNRHNARVQAGHAPRGALGLGRSVATEEDMKEKRASSDGAMDELRDLRETYAGGEDSGPAPEGSVTVRWAYEIIAPSVVGAIALVFLMATG